jgi:hypothetical protein
MPKKRQLSESEEESSEWDSDQSEESEDEEESLQKKVSMHDLPLELRNVVYEFCGELKKKTIVPKYNKEDETEIKMFIFEHFQSCLDYSETRLNLEEHGLFEVNKFIRYHMMVGLVCDVRTVDPNEPNPCECCGKEEKTLKEDGSNFRDVVFVCSGLTKDQNGFFYECQNSHCFACSGMQEPYDPFDEDSPYWCKDCNTPEKISSSLLLEKEREVQPRIDIWSKDDEKVPALEVEKKVINVFGGGGGNVTIRHVQSLYNLKPHQTPSIKMMNHGGVVVKEGYFEKHRKVTVALPEEEEEVFVKFHEEYTTSDNRITEMRGKTVKVSVIEYKIKAIWKKLRVNQKKGERANGKMSILAMRSDVLIKERTAVLTRTWSDEIEKALENVALDKKSKKEKKMIALANKNIQAEISKMKEKAYMRIPKVVKKYKPMEIQAIKNIGKYVKDILELLRISRNKMDKKPWEKWHKRCDKALDFLKEEYIIEEKDESDDESEDRDDENWSMDDAEADNEED